MRINKFLAEAGVSSRRGADELVTAGVVRINGVVAVSGDQVDEENDIVEVRGKRVTLPNVAPCYLMLNKPVRVVTTAKDPEGRTTVLDLVPRELSETNGRQRRLYPVGRLDFFSEGLLLITDDGELTQRLVHPRYHVPKTYLVTVRGTLTQQDVQKMRDGMTLAEGETLEPIGVRVIRQDKSEFEERALLEIVLHQGLNRQIRRMCRDLELTVLRLVRVAQGPLRLGKLPAGKVRALTPEELRALRQAVGLEEKK